MNHSSLWADTVSLPIFSPLSVDEEVDVAIVGAGIAGLTAGLQLQRAGQRVAMVEARRLGDGETSHTTAHLTEVLDTRYYSLESKFGRQGARAAAESSRAAIDKIELFIREFGADCGFSRVPGYLFAVTVPQRKLLEKEFDALQRMGSEVAWTDGFPLPITTQGAVRIERQAQFHPLEYLRELASQFMAAGGRIFESTRVLDVKDGVPCRVVTDAAELTAKEVLVLSHSPVSTKVGIHTKLASYRSYAIAVQHQDRFPPGLYWDLDDPYHYLRTQETSAGNLLIVGGEDHKVGQNEDTEASFRHLEEYTQNHFGETQTQYRWSGQIVEPADGLPFIGKQPGTGHVYLGTGFSGTGMTFGTLAGLILSDLVLGTPNPWAALYDATRVKPFAQAREYIAENVDFPAHLAKDRLDTGEVSSPDEIPAGEGCRLRANGKMLAVYRDKKGTLHTRSAACTHMGCHVAWNKAEQTWDCPCHGSRFGVDGEVINGPATKALEEASVIENVEHDPRSPE